MSLTLISPNKRVNVKYSVPRNQLTFKYKCTTSTYNRITYMCVCLREHNSVGSDITLYMQGSILNPVPPIIHIKMVGF